MKFAELVDSINKGLIKLKKYQGGSYSGISMTSTPVELDEHSNQHWILKTPLKMKPDELPMNLTARVG